MLRREPAKSASPPPAKVIFDVEAIFFFPWAVVYKKYLTINSFILVEMGVFLAILLVGYYYVLRKGALEWE